MPSDEHGRRTTQERPKAVRLTIEFEDGEVQEATGEDAEKWATWFNTGVGLAVAHGESPPDFEFDKEPEWLDD